MEKAITDRKQIITDIAKKYIAGVSIRGDLEMRGCDSEDCIEITVGGLQAALEAAYSAGQQDRIDDN